MKDGVRLEREVEVLGWRFTGEVSRATPRDWEIAVLRLVRERGTVDGEDVASELLNGLPALSQRLLGICTRLGLLTEQKRRFALTDAGRAAADSGVVFLPAWGAWTLWATPDPLLPERVLGVEPWAEPSAHEEVIGRRQGAGQDDAREMAPLPDWLTARLGQALTPPTGDGTAIRIDDFGHEGKAEVVATSAQLRLALSVSAAATRLDLAGELEGRPVETTRAVPDLDFGKVWSALLDGAGLRSAWDVKKAVLRVAFEDTDDGERGTRLRTQRFDQPELEGIGAFEPTEVAGVPILPRTAADAAAWARWRLLRSVETYATADAYREWTAAAREPFAEFRPALPGRAALAQELRGAAVAEGTPPGAAYWHLQAPEDWKL